MENINLNSLSIPGDGANVPQNNFSAGNGNIEVYFKNIEEEIIKKIEQYDCVIGCVAWLTNENILKALSKKKECIIIIQEEDFLRPDTSFNGDKLKWAKKMKKLYNALSGGNNEFYTYLGISICCSHENGIRRCGYLNKNKLPAFPRMHNKFIICYNYINENFSNLSESIDGEVITGSYNYTENGNNSLENIVCIKDKTIVEAYSRQFGEISLLSVPLDWNKEWAPNKSELRYGT